MAHQWLFRDWSLQVEVQIYLRLNKCKFQNMCFVGGRHNTEIQKGEAAAQQFQNMCFVGGRHNMEKGEAAAQSNHQC